MVKGWTPISVTDDLATDLESMWKEDRKRPKNQKFSPWVNNLLLKYVEFNKELKEYGPFLEFIEANDNEIFIADHRPKKLNTTVYIKDDKKELQCIVDKSIDCIHVGFCFAIPEVYKVLIEHGFKEPKR